MVLAQNQQTSPLILLSLPASYNKPDSQLSSSVPGNIHIGSVVANSLRLEMISRYTTPEIGEQRF